jgi:hypothetical protein
VKRIIGQNDARLKKNQGKAEVEAKKADKASEVVREVYAWLNRQQIPFLLTSTPAHKCRPLSFSNTTLL